MSTIGPETVQCLSSHARAHHTAAHMHIVCMWTLSPCASRRPHDVFRDVALLRLVGTVANALVGGVVVPVRLLFAGRPWIDGRLSARSCNTVLSTFCPQSVQRLSSRMRQCGPHGRLPVNVAHPWRLSTICLATVRRLLSCCVFSVGCVHNLSMDCPVLVQSCRCTPRSRTHAPYCGRCGCLLVVRITMYFDSLPRAVYICRCGCICGRSCRARAAAVGRQSIY